VLAQEQRLLTVIDQRKGTSAISGMAAMWSSTQRRAMQQQPDQPPAERSGRRPAFVAPHARL